jgi:hypothetical protein
MLAQIKSLPEGEMKAALLETYIKTVRAAQKGQNPTARKPPLFLEASYEKNTKTYMKFNREPKPQNLTLSDLASDLSALKQAVADIQIKLNFLQQETEHSYPVDSWARQEILELKKRIDHIPPPLEDAPYSTFVTKETPEEGEQRSAVQAFSDMQVLTVSYQKYYVHIQLEIMQEIFSLTALIDTGSDINLLHKDKMASYMATKRIRKS